MKFNKVIRSISTKNDLKRFCSAYVVDHRNLQEDEIIPALEKTAPQYFYPENVEQAWRECRLHKEQDIRLIAWIMLTHVLLNKDDFMLAVAETDKEVIEWERLVIDAANENPQPTNGTSAKNLDLFRFVLETAWDQDNDITPDEQNLISNLRRRLNITEFEYRVIEASLGKFPQPGNEVHLRSHVDSARRHLQTAGFITMVRDDDGQDYDIIPEEIAACLRQILGIEIRQHGYQELLKYKAVRKKSYYIETLKKVDCHPKGSETLEELRDLIIHRVKPSILLGGTTPRDGLAHDAIVDWCRDLNLQVSGTKAEVMARIIGFYDHLKQRDDEVEDARTYWFAEYLKFAARDHAYLRAQQLIEKDIEIERKFEDATKYLFEFKLGHRPLKQVGTEHADGALSHGDGLILWDNKSKELPVHLPDHIKQFARYISASEKRVSAFLVIGPSFTPESAVTAMSFFVEKQTIITLVTAEELKNLADSWEKKGDQKSRGSFPLGFLIQQGRFNPDLINI
ncbi:hypothetical protein JO972_13230 [Verrucomicrobiaceae bacterium 5K15]|uniref:SAP domain-containing protein n=1 Tax=Oceaniferula flava TaxID=2800421 RepID=A0AAE2V9X8_9BACT|nr:hypothetical protein [Oceaniferula flavus]MBK1855928.1 hypothetical protein [Oceaniferula flavus]MBM1137235.1 hypothetical protein [Oceaniferula flavus]